MSLEASDVAVRVRLVGGSAFETEADKVAASTERIGTAGKAANDKSALASAEIVGFGSKLDKAGSKMQSVGKGLTEATVPFAALGVYASKTATSFNALMTQLVTQSNLPRKNLQGLTKDVLALSGAVAQTPTSLAKGLQNIVGSGIRNTPKAMQVLKESGQMATVGGDTVSDTSNALTSIISSGLAKNMSFPQVAGYIDAAIGHSKMKMSDITSAMNTSILPEAKMTHTSLAQVLATAAGLSREGIDPSTEMSRLRLTMTSALSPTAMGRKAMGAMGFKNPLQLAGDLQHGGLLNMLSDLKTHANRLPGGFSGTMSDDLIAQMFGKSRGMGNIAALLEKLPELNSIYSQVLKTGTPALWQKHFGETMQTPAAKQAAARAKLDASMIKLGNTINDRVLPVVLRLVGPLTSVLNGFAKLPKSVQNFIMFGVLAGTILGPMMMLGGSFLKLLSPLTKLGGAEGLTGLAAETEAASGGMAGLVIAIPLAVAAFNSIPELLGGKSVSSQITSGLDNLLNPESSGNPVRNKLLAAHGGMTKSEIHHFAKKHPGQDPYVTAYGNSAGMTGAGPHGSFTNKQNHELFPGFYGTNGFTGKIASAIKDGIKEAGVSVYLPNGRVLAKEVNSTNRKSQNRR